MLAHQVGRNDVAVQLVRQAIARADGRADYHSNLGLILNQLGLHGEAEASLRIALRLQPEYPDALNNLGIALSALSRVAEAEAAYLQALRLRPNFPDALNNLGLAQAKLGRTGEAEAIFRAALRFDPDLADAHGNLGIALAAQNRPAEAEASYREALRLRPGFRDALNNLGVLLSERGRASEAEGCLRQALSLAPDQADAHSNLAAVLTRLGRPGEAEDSARQALRLAPGDAEAHFNLGAALHDTRRIGEAEASYRQALRLKQNFADAHVNLGYALLLAGRYEEGWPEHEWRWRGRHLKAGARSFSEPLWTGEAIAGRTLLLHAEQGLGDTLQFCRYAALIEPGARIVLEVQPPLTRLMKSLPGNILIVAHGDPIPSFDLQCPLLSLPLAFKTVVETIPVDIPYVAADRVAAARWRQRLAILAGLRVGLVWAGGERRESPELAAVDARRSIRLDALAPLCEVDGVSFVSLQKGPPSLQAAAPPPGMDLFDPTADLTDFADTAALLEGLDLVISVDTSVAHLAGAMGKPVWLLNRFDTCWRWLLSRDDSPWYPTLRQFRQSAPGDWKGVMLAVRAALEMESARKRSARVTSVEC